MALSSRVLIVSCAMCLFGVGIIPEHAITSSSKVRFRGSIRVHALRSYDANDTIYSIWRVQLYALPLRNRLRMSLKISIATGGGLHQMVMLGDDRAVRNIAFDPGVLSFSRLSVCALLLLFVLLFLLLIALLQPAHSCFARLCISHIKSV
jgi:hypothetical protein